MALSASSLCKPCDCRSGHGCDQAVIGCANDSHQYSTAGLMSEKKKKNDADACNTQSSLKNSSLQVEIRQCLNPSPSPPITTAERANLRDGAHDAVQDINAERNVYRAALPSPPQPDCQLQMGRSSAAERANLRDGALDAVQDINAERNVYVALPSLPQPDCQLQIRRSSRFSLRTFIDKSVSPLSAAFTSHMPLTLGMRTRPLRIMNLLWLVFAAAIAVAFAVRTKAVKSYLGTEACLPSDEASFCFTALCSLNVGLAAKAELLARRKQFRNSIVYQGLLFCVAGLATVMNSIVCYVRSDLLSSAIWLLVALSFLMLAYSWLFKENTWLWSMIYFGAAFTVAGYLMIFMRRAWIWSACCIMGPVLVITITVVLVRRHIALQRARSASLPYIERYTAIWKTVREGQDEQLQMLDQTVKRQNYVKKVQPTADLSKLFKLGLELDEWYQGVVHLWAEMCGAEARVAPMKGRQRALEKLTRSYSGDVSKLVDIVRSCIVCASLEQVRQALLVVFSYAQVHMVKNRYHVGYNAANTCGYRDVNVQLSFRETVGSRFGGLIFELQIILKVFLDVKSDTDHKYYVQLRNLLGQ